MQTGVNLNGGHARRFERNLRDGLDTLIQLLILAIYGWRKEERCVNVIISNASGAPIYEQIVSQIKAAILKGEVAEGEMLPSIRALAKDLRISVITTKRAYDELEREGLIVTMAGKGCFVAARNPELIREGVLREIEAHMTKIAELAAQAGIGADDLKDMFDLLELGGQNERD